VLFPETTLTAPPQIITRGTTVTVRLRRFQFAVNRKRRTVMSRSSQAQRPTSGTKLRVNYEVRLTSRSPTEVVNEGDHYLQRLTPWKLHGQL
jgi:hypothetical protein